MKAKKAMKVLKPMLPEGGATKKAMKALLMKATETMKGKLATAEAMKETQAMEAVKTKPAMKAMVAKRAMKEIGRAHV